MNSVLFKNIIRFVLLVLIQVFVFNNMNLSGYLNPYIYILFILLLPVDISKSLLLVLAFLLGITIDFFGNTLGLHASATLIMAFARPAILNLFFSNIEFTPGEEPSLSRLKFGGFFRFTFALVFIHHAALFILEIFSFNHFLFTLYRIMLSTMLTMLLIFISMLLFSKKKN